MRTNGIKRVLAFCFALFMLVGMAKVAVIDASAEEPGTSLPLPADSWNEGRIRVDLDAGETDRRNVTVKAYKLVSVHTGALQGTDSPAYQPQLPEYTWESGIAGWIRANYPNYIGPAPEGKPADDSVQEAFSTDQIVDNAFELQVLYGRIEAAIMNGTISGLPSVAVAAPEEGTASISGLTMGVYLVTATGGTAVYRPTVLSITPEDKDSDGIWTITSPAAGVLKSSPVSLVKTITAVNNASAEVVSSDGKRAVAGIGDTVSYKLEVDVPTYPSQSVSMDFRITDTLSEGLTLTEGSVKVEADGTEIQDLSDRIGVSGQVLTIDLTPDISKDVPNPIDGKTKLVVTYDAVLNEKAVLGVDADGKGNLNTAALTYSNNPYGVPDAAANSRAADDTVSNTRTVTDTATVFTFGIEVTKVQKGTTNPLSGAQFELKDAAGNKINFTGTDGTYTKDAQGTAILTTGTNGKLTIKGLAPGQYKLKETKAPAGYVLSAAETEITIADTNFNGIPDSKEQPTTDTTTTQTTTTQTTEKDKDNGLVSITVENTKGFTLPRTGGIGTVLFSMIGIVLMGSGVLLVAVFLRKRFGKSR